VLTEYEKAPQVTRERMYLEMMQQVLGSTSKVIIDTKSGNNLLYLPLDKLMQLSSANAQPVDSTPRAASVPETPAPVTEAPTSRRDAMRSRDREGGR